MVTEIKGMGMVTKTCLVPGYSWEDQATRDVCESSPLDDNNRGLKGMGKPVIVT